MSSGRAGSAARRGSSSRKSALEEIRRLREGGGLRAAAEEAGGSRLAQYTAQEESIYKTVSENEYEELVRQRRSGLPFVENDDGEMGYYDDGEEQFFESDPEPDEREHGQGDEDAGAGRKRGAGALSSAYSRRAKKLQRAKLGGGGDQKITNMFFSAPKTKASASAASTASGARQRPVTAKQDMDLDSMLDDLTSNPTESRQAYARPISYSSGSSSLSGGSSAFPSALARSSASFFDDDKDAASANLHGNMDDNAFEMGADEEQEEEDYNDTTNADVSMEEDDESVENAAHAESAASVKEEEEEEQSAAKPKLSKRDLLLARARQTQLQTSLPTARVLAGAMEEDDKDDVKGEDRAAMVHDVPSNEVAEWWQVAGSMADAAKDPEDPEELEEPEAAPGSSDSIRMFWMDAVEVRNRPGKIYLIGKMKVPSSSSSSGAAGAQFKSCCVVVNNLQRYMYLVPRQTLKELGREQQQQQWMQMHEEIHNVLVPSCISSVRDQDAFRTKLVERDYAFEAADMPRGKNLFVKVKYPAKYPAPPSDVCSRGGKTFRRVCGAFTRPLENFLLKRKLLGPGWIEVANVRKVATNVSFCHAEFETLDPKHVRSVQGDGLSPPPLTVMSLSVKSVCNPHTNKHEVVALSALVETGVSAEGAGRKQQQGGAHRISHFTSVRPIDANRGFPEAYTRAAQRDERFAAKPADAAKGVHAEKLHLALNERMLLTYFLARVQQEDPDVVVGHNLHKYALDLLISRVDHHKLGGLWSKLTRLRRGNLRPMNAGEGWNEYRMDDVVNGRLFCDTYVSAKELLPSQNNYSLSYLVETQLSRHRVEVEMTDIPQILDGGAGTFVKFLRHTLDDAMFVLHLMHKLEVLPLSKQLANLCGYLWTRTLEANKRAERIEYLLLHEFSRSARKFIVPEKFKTKSEADKAGGKRREAAYAGGMVFAPKKGLYDNFVVLLDFNSLYPSIIREYNICFTTVERQLMEDDGTMASSRSSSKTKKTKKARPMPQLQNDEVVDDEDVDHDVDDAEAPGSDADIPPLPSSACEEGVLPGVIKRLLESRKQVKRALKAAQLEGNAEAANRLDIRQKAIKLTANSMYGCLGFRFSRFYAKPIAALITSTGRQTLQRAKEVAEQECGYDVIYGDTDSIMVDSRTDQLEDAKRIGREVQTQCNKHFKLLELEVDYIFKTILLLNKKKYAALVLKEQPGGGGGGPAAAEPVFEKEVKGLDLVRRDWCVISKAVGNEVLDFILSGSARDEVVESIHEHLQQVAERIRSGKEPIEQFVITKSLNKQPEQYPDRAKQHHVQVALALRAQGRPIGAGSHIPYIICVEEEPGSGRRAYHPEEVRRAGGKLSVDVEWYLEAQIHPPVNRLCAHIEGTSSPQLAHCLGLDTSKFSHAATHLGEDGDGADAIPSVLQSDADRFKDCAPLELPCRRCRATSAFPGVFRLQQDGSPAVSGLRCPADGCGADLWGYDGEGVNGEVGDELVAVLSNRLHLATRASAGRYYEGWAVCSDVTCKTRTQKQSLRGNGNICAAPGCRATVSMEFPDGALYTQLKFFASLFDVQRARNKLQARGGGGGGIGIGGGVGGGAEPPALPETHLAVLRKLSSQAERAVRRDDYNWVKPSIWQTLFT